MQDIIIIWAGAAWLFASINLPKDFKKIILEKNAKPWVKVLLSWGERANVSNMDIVWKRDYFGQNKKALISIFNRFSNWDIISFFEENNIKIIEEDRWRLILESWDSKELLNLLLKKSKDNNTELRCNSPVDKIVKLDNSFEVILSSWEKLQSRNVIVSCWWKSFFQVWTTGDWYNFAEELWIKIVPPHRWLCALTTKKDLSTLSWSSCDLNIELVDNKKSIYTEFWPLLFTHFWISWPIVFNTWIALWEYLNSLDIDYEKDKIKYILNNIEVKLVIKKENTTKKIYSFFKEEIDNEEEIKFWLQDWRTWKEAKITGWGVDIDELDKYMQVKKLPWLFFIWEVVDITWKTWWFNLQWAWSSAFACSEKFN